MATYHQIIQEVRKIWIVSYTQELVREKYSSHKTYQRLLEPLEAWTNQDYQSLSKLSKIQEASLKRILGYAGITSRKISDKNETKLIKYLGYADNPQNYHRDLIRTVYQYVREME